MNGIAIVTGGSGGLGAAICERLGRDGYHIHLTYRSREDKAKKVVSRIEAAGGTAEASPLDLSDLAAVDRFAHHVENSPLPPSVLVNCAGEVLRLPFEDTDVGSFMRSLTVNCAAPFLLSQRFGQIMRDKSDGSIVNISSVLSEVGGHDRVAYTASKAAMVGLTKALAVELAPSVRVNALLPGLFATAMNAALLDDEQRLAKTEGHVPLGRLGSPDEIAEVATFLAGSGSSYVTGAIWTVDGGILTRISGPLGDAP